jgi:hypothetical protein
VAIRVLAFCSISYLRESAESAFIGVLSIFSFHAAEVGGAATGAQCAEGTENDAE